MRYLRVSRLLEVLEVIRGLERKLRFEGIRSFVYRRVNVTFWFLAGLRSRGDHGL
jgi:hypothetical protein